MGNDLWAYELSAFEKGYNKIAGVDEAGRGPIAGPVVSAAVILPLSYPIEGVTDSKKLTPKKRDFLYDIIYERAVSIGIGIIDPTEIERINILRASLLSMSIAVQNLSPKSDFLLIDGIFPIPIPYTLSQQTIPHGDSLSLSVAAASIIAKVTRDRLMEKYHYEYPEYGFIKHKGYPTKEHKEAIRRSGCCPIHRRGFKGVKEVISQTDLERI
ncbi:MAG: ribonuclease HII [Proteobacteria bacterium]|nr:ribonuclease HII [Pseudomonadota bacterium]MBU4036850.1 ribonuclease HII [Pseudomonadota bacterium]